VRPRDQNQRVVCGAAEVAMGLYINGHSVPTVGVSGVGVAFDARGSGCGAMLLNEVMCHCFVRRYRLVLYAA
jgi:predicted acetyltransferase